MAGPLLIWWAGAGWSFLSRYPRAPASTLKAENAKKPLDTRVFSILNIIKATHIGRLSFYQSLFFGCPVLT